MPHTVEIGIYPLAKTAVDREAVRKWLDDLGAENYEVPSENLSSDPALLVALAAKRCYKSFVPGLNPNVNKVRKDLTEYLDNVLKSGHGSVLEHVVWTFAIENVSRVFTGEMNRHRAGVAISEGSMRFIRYGDIPYWLPTCLREQPNDTGRLVRKKRMSEEVFQKAFHEMEENYAALSSIWAEELAEDSKFADKKHVTSMMRRIIGMGVATGGVWSMNIRAVRHIIGMRATEAAEEEIYHVFSRVAKMMVEAEPMLCGDITQDEKGFYHPKYWKV